jgi:hypothetical protein
MVLPRFRGQVDSCIGDLKQLQHIATIATLAQRCGQGRELFSANPALAPGHLLRAAHLQALAVLQGADVAAGFVQRITGAGIEPGIGGIVASNRLLLSFCSATLKCCPLFSSICALSTCTAVAGYQFAPSPVSTPSLSPP